MLKLVAQVVEYASQAGATKRQCNVCRSILNYIYLDRMESPDELWFTGSTILIGWNKNDIRLVLYIYDHSDPFWELIVYRCDSSGRRFVEGTSSSFMAVTLLLKYLK